ncbi:hypothetical protein ACLOJK_025274 [Asimina triloba]
MTDVIIGGPLAELFPRAKIDILEDVAIRNDNVLPVMRLDEHDSLNNEPEPMGFTEEQHDQKFLDGMDPIAFLEELQQCPEDMDENNYLQELHPCAEYTPSQGEIFNIPEDKKPCGSMEENTNVSEFCQMPIKEEYVDVKDVTNPVEADCPVVGELVQDDCTYFDASYHDQPQSEEGCFLEFDDLLNPGEAYHTSEFENLDDMLMYFDATADNLASFDFEPILAPEITGVTSPENVECQQKSKPSTMEDASSSKQKLEAKTINDVHYEGGWDKSIAKRFSGMLESISAPPAFAAEYGLQERIKSVGQNSNHSGSIQLTAGIFYISDRLTISSIEKPWSLQKGRNVEFLVSYGISGVDVITTEPNAEIPGKAMSMLWRAGLYLCFIWVPILAVSFKFGSFIYSK